MGIGNLQYLQDNNTITGLGHKLGPGPQSKTWSQNTRQEKNDNI